jgi:hypothetical protein
MHKKHEINRNRFPAQPAHKRNPHGHCSARKPAQEQMVELINATRIVQIKCRRHSHKQTAASFKPTPGFINNLLRSGILSINASASRHLCANGTSKFAWMSHLHDGHV